LTINQPPHDKMDEKPASLKQEFKHLFNTPIDAIFAIMTYAFWETMALEINCYASQYMKEYKKNSILGKKCEPFSIGDDHLFWYVDILPVISSDWSSAAKYMKGQRI
jgi:hypothetical protein